MKSVTHTTYCLYLHLSQPMPWAVVSNVTITSWDFLDVIADGCRKGSSETTFPNAGDGQVWSLSLFHHWERVEQYTAFHIILHNVFVFFSVSFCQLQHLSSSALQHSKFSLQIFSYHSSLCCLHQPTCYCLFQFARQDFIVPYMILHISSHTTLSHHFIPIIFCLQTVVC